jgi:hypothetical protein
MKKNVLLGIATLALVLSAAIVFGCSEGRLQSINDIECRFNVLGENGERKVVFEYGEPFVIRYTETNIRACNIKYSTSDCPYCSFQVLRKKDKNIIKPLVKTHPCQHPHETKSIGSQGVNVAEFLWRFDPEEDLLEPGEYLLSYKTAINYPELGESKSHSFEVPFEIKANESTAYSWFSEDSFRY